MAEESGQGNNILIEDTEKVVAAVKALVAGVDSVKTIGGVNIHLDPEDNRIIKYIQLWFKKD